MHVLTIIPPSEIKNRQRPFAPSEPPTQMTTGTNTRNAPHVRAFLSFTMNDGTLVASFKTTIKRQCPSLELLEHPVRRIYQEDWKHQCEMKIRKSALIICLIGNSTHKSEAVTWEIAKALALGKRILAVNLVGGEPPLPDILKTEGIIPIGMNAHNIFSDVADVTRVTHE